MINKVIITDLSKAESYAFGGKNDYNVWVTVIDEEDEHKVSRMKKLLSNKGVSHFAQYFHDWSDEDQDEFIKKNIEVSGPQLQHVNNIISFLEPIVQSEKIYNLGVNCFAGVSRSTAIGIIALVMSGKTPKEALDIIIGIRPMAWPNLRILRFASERLGQDLATPVKEWKKVSSVELYKGATGGWHC
jgi:predicted protein tyrosine phosphatase